MVLGGDSSARKGTGPLNPHACEKKSSAVQSYQKRGLEVQSLTRFPSQPCER